AAVPVVTEIEVISSETCGNKLEDRQWHTTSVDLLENEADSLLACVLAKRDYGELIASECVKHLSAELHVLAEFLRSVLLETFFPCIRIEDLVTREVEGLAFLLRCREIKHDVAAKIRLDLSVFLDGDKGVLETIIFQRSRDI